MASLIERFTKKYVVRLDSKCWEWIGGRMSGTAPHRYGAFRMDGYRPAMAHRCSYIIFKGEIPAGLFICHSCDNASCVNPDHLFVGTAKDNASDCWKKGRAYLQTGVKPALGKGISHRSKDPARGWVIDVLCSECGVSMEQNQGSAARGCPPCCSLSCRHTRLGRLNRERLLGAKNPPSWRTRRAKALD